MGEDLNPDQRRLWDRGLVLLRAGAGYEAHEVWEQLWHGLRRSPQPAEQRLGRLLRALIQLAAGLHLRAQGRWSGARAVFDRAAAGIAALEQQPESPPRLLGLELRALRRSLAAAASDGEHDPRSDPGIGWRWPEDIAGP